MDKNAISGGCEPEAAIARLGGDRELYREVLSSFLDGGTSGPIARIAEALSAGNADELHKAAHNLKGTAATCGAVSVASVCGRLEAIALERDLTIAPQMLSELRAEFDEASRQLAVYAG